MAMSASMKADEDRWRLEDDIRTLSRAAEIQKDKARMKKIRAHLKTLNEAVDEESKD